MASAAEQAVRLWHEQQATNSPASGAANPAAPQNSAALSFAFAGG